MDTKIYIIFLFVISVGCSRIVNKENVGNLRREPPRTAKSLKPKGEVMENLFTLYDPSFLAVVWPKISNGVHLSINHFCWEDVSRFFKDLSDGRAWAYNVADASGRYQSGLFSGNRFWLGSKKQCMKLDNDFLTRDANGTWDDHHDREYSKEVMPREKFYGTRGQEWNPQGLRDEQAEQASAMDGLPACRLAYSAARLRLNVTKPTMTKSYDITLGLCLPLSCSVEDIESIVTFSIMINDNLKSNKTVPRSVKITSLRQVEEYYYLGSDTGAIILICVTLLLLLLSIVATLVELNLFKCKLKPRTSRSVSFDLQKYNNTETHSRYFETVNKKHIDMTWKDTNLAKITTSKTDECKDLSPAKSGVILNTVPPTVTLDVMSTERSTGSCNRCGKYKRQCSNPTQTENIAACPRVKYNSAASLSTTKRSSMLKRLLLCYSLNYSWSRVFNTNMANKDLAVMHVLRIIATFWIIYVHVALMVNYIADDAGEVNDRNEFYYVLATGTLAFDTLLFVSGLFSAHHFFYLKSHYTVEELVSFGGTCGQVLQFVCFVTNRIIRLLPSYAYVVLFSGVAARVARATSPLWLPDGDADNCDVYWWRNLLYISNLYPADERCMQISWYLSAETQLHMLGALVCAARGAGGAVGAGGAGARLAVALAAGALLAAHTSDLTAAYHDYGHYLPGVYEAYSLIIERTCARFIPYFTGVLTGWIVHKSNGRLKVSKVTASCLWFASVTTIVTSLIVPWLASEWLSAWLHITWPIALLWPSLVLTTNLAPACRGWACRGWVSALSRLSGGALLLHAAAARRLLLAARHAPCARAACLWMYFAGTSLLTLLGSLALTLLVEMPCCSLLRRISDCATV